MSPARLFLFVSLLSLLVPPIGFAQVNPRRWFDSETSDLGEPYYATRYQQWFRDQQRKGQLARSQELLDFREREMAYVADACGLGCDHHEGLQVQGIPGTFLSVALYKVLSDDDRLTVQLRFHNDGVVPARLTVDPSVAPGSFSIQIGEQRLPVRMDEDRQLESKGALDVVLQPGEIESWWARFPAPPAGATTFDLHIPAVTFRDVPLDTD